LARFGLLRLRFFARAISALIEPQLRGFAIGESLPQSSVV
jgi:hypothetical protein